MDRKFNMFQIVGKTYKSVLKIVPFSGIASPFYYVLDGLFPAIIALISAKLFDGVYAFLNYSDELNTVIKFGAFFVLIYVIKYLFQIFFSIPINAGVYEKCSSFFRLQISEKLVKLSLIDFENAEILNMRNRAQECVNREVLSRIYMMVAVFTTSAIGAVSVITVLASYSVWFLPISVFSVLPYFIARIIRGKEFWKLKHRQAKRIRIRDYLFSLFSQKETVKEMRVMGFGDYITQKWKDNRDNVNEELWTHNRKDIMSLMLCDIIKIAGYGASIIFAFALVIQGDISVGVFGACIGAFLSVQENIRVFLNELGRLPEFTNFANDYYMFMQLDDENTSGENFGGVKNKIIMENVRFSYPNSDSLALDNISLTINKHERIALIGENGSGKTTLSKVLLGIYDIEKGDIFYDDTNVLRINKQSLFKKVSIIAQDFIKYKLTFRENIAISDIDNITDDERIKSTLKSEGVDDVSNIDDMLGREFGGRELSGGQWQRLAIARAMFKDSEIIILDEPTSALDPIIEMEILSKFLEVSGDKTSIIISHRVGLCAKVDKIIVMKDGKIVETGSHDKLIKNNGEYARLFEAQQKWYN